MFLVISYVARSINPFHLIDFSLQVDPQNTRLYAYQQNSYRYLYTSPRILLAPALFLLAGGLIQYFAQRYRVRSNHLCKSIVRIFRFI